MMKSKLLNTLILAALAVPSLAMAEEASPFSGNVTLTTDYLYRGLTQTNHRGAIQGGFDYVGESGFYAGAWGSNISWLTDGIHAYYNDTANTDPYAGYTDGAGLELDTYAGYTAGFADDFTYNVGVLRYNYSGNLTAGATSANTNEVYGSLGWKMLTVKYSRSLTNLFGVVDSSGSGYLELNAGYTLEGPGLDLSAHYGKQTINTNPSSDYTDYNVKVAKDFGGYTLAFLINKTNITDDTTRGVLSLSHAM